MKNIQVAIDGPASSGKSTVAKLIAQSKGYTYIDTGAMYRAVTLAVIRHQVDLDDMRTLSNLLNQLDIKFKWENGQQETYLNGENVTLEIRSAQVTSQVSAVSALSQVRDHLVAQQQAMAIRESVIMDGRDIGTVVLPDADFKFFLVASPRVRAERRFLEDQKRGILNQTLEELEEAIIQRDHLDSTRKVSPLVQASDAILIDTSNLSIEEVVKTIMIKINA